ncbi:hypothetical protein [Mycolicibacterium aromaticivorans]|uniref:hypothetical protein n=1 Tax=Mycolicibacterium aromaticivorans TaxID=318425 RepID=UPI00103EEBE0|nr:hypothetical protein [Mycolicibacterium aromaticivorans]
MAFVSFVDSGGSYTETFVTTGKVLGTLTETQTGSYSGDVSGDTLAADTTFYTSIAPQGYSLKSLTETLTVTIDASGVLNEKQTGEVVYVNSQASIISVPSNVNDYFPMTKVIGI